MYRLVLDSSILNLLTTPRLKSLVRLEFPLPLLTVLMFMVRSLVSLGKIPLVMTSLISLVKSVLSTFSDLISKLV